MPKIDPFSYLIDAVSTLTGGLVTDLKTLILGILVLQFIWFGFTYIVDVFEESMESRSRSRNFEKAKEALFERNQLDRGTAEYDLASLKYRNLLKKSL